jgi:hypothetical protein
MLWILKFVKAYSSLSYMLIYEIGFKLFKIVNHLYYHIKCEEQAFTNFKIQSVSC